MKSIKVSQIWCPEDYRYLIIPKIIQEIFQIKIIWTTPQKCDLLMVGTLRKFGKLRKTISSKFNFLKNKTIDNFDKKIFFRRNKPITIFYSRENERRNFEKCDFSIGTDFNYDNNDNYLRIPIWKEYCDWSNHGLTVSPEDKLNARRFGQHYSIEKLRLPMDKTFIEKPKKICAFFSHLNSPRDQLLKKISLYFDISLYGPAFDKEITNHNSSDFIKIDKMKNYFSNFCPENELYPGWYTEKVPDAFLAGTLAITWADQSIEYDFNKNSFINLNDYKISELNNLFDELKSDEFLKKFQNEPLITTKINLDEEIAFTKKILNKLNVIS